MTKAREELERKVDLLLQQMEQAAKYNSPAMDILQQIAIENKGTLMPQIANICSRYAGPNLEIVLSSLRNTNGNNFESLLVALQSDAAVDFAAKNGAEKLEPVLDLIYKMISNSNYTALFELVNRYEGENLTSVLATLKKTSGGFLIKSPGSLEGVMAVLNQELVANTIKSSPQKAQLLLELASTSQNPALVRAMAELLGRYSGEVLEIITTTSRSYDIKRLELLTDTFTDEYIAQVANNYGEKALRSLIDTAAKGKSAVRTLAFGIQQTFAPQQGNRDFFYKSGETWLEQGCLDEAISNFSVVIKFFSSDSEVCGDRGRAYLRKNFYDEALADFAAVIKLDPRNDAAFHNRGLAHAAKNEHDKAILDFSEAIKLDSDYLGSYHQRGKSYFELKEYTKAAQDFSEVIRRDQKHASAYMERGKSYLAWQGYGGWGAGSGRNEQAILDFSRVVQLERHNYSAYYHRGLAQYHLKRFDSAIKDFSEAIRINPQNSEAYHLRGQARYYKRKYDKAIRDYNKVIELEPQNASAYYNRGLAWLEKSVFRRGGYGASEHDVQDAQDDFSTAIGLNPKFTDAYFQRGSLFYRLDKHTEAIADYTEVIKLDGRHDTAYYNRGLAKFYRKQYGDAREAKKDFQRALALNSRHTKVEEFLKKIETIMAS